MDYDKLKDGKPCDHKGCLNHVSHPCEYCGRIAGIRVKGTVKKMNVTHVSLNKGGSFGLGGYYSFDD